MKKCSRCGSMKPLGEFHRRNRPDGRQPWCKECRKSYDHAYHARNRERLVALAKKRHQDFLERHRRLKSTTPCSDCGGFFHFAAMEWDHLPGTTKTAEISTQLSRVRSRKNREEMAKCEVVCANCEAVRCDQGIGAELIVV